ncbi:unnamed protein product [Bubo scandiacus]
MSVVAYHLAAFDSSSYWSSSMSGTAALIAGSTDQLMDGDQGISVGTVLPPVHRLGGNWHSLLFNLKRPHHRGIL